MYAFLIQAKTFEFFNFEQRKNKGEKTVENEICKFASLKFFDVSYLLPFVFSVPRGGRGRGWGQLTRKRIHHFG